MCGIIGYSGKENAVPLILEGLQKLEYRGYDSAGIALYAGKRFEVIKKKGRLAVLAEEVSKKPLYSNTGIGHTRWATHGEPSNANSHPHLGSGKKIAVVHNGIIENYKILREFLEKKGIGFVSETDSEVIAQLAEYYYEGDIFEATVKVINALEGSYALGIMCVDCSDKIIAVKKDNPLIVGFSPEGNFIASDVPAILKYTDKVYYLGDKEIAVLEKDKVSFFSKDGDVLVKTPETVAWDSESAEKGGYEHFMFKEIAEQPRVLKDTINSMLGGKNSPVVDSIDISAFNKIIITACGSAYNAGMVARYVWERLLGITVEVDLASEFRYRDIIADERTLVVIISQSGETADTIAAMREAKRKGAVTLAIVNVIGSTIAKEADHVVYTVAGPEIAVATTKALSAQLVALYLLGVSFGKRLNRITEAQEKQYIDDITALPSQLSTLLEHPEKVQEYAAGCFNCKSIFFIGRNIDYAIAMEGSLKLKEISYIHSEAYAGGELKHGTISLIEDNTLVVAISCCSRLYNKTLSNIEQVVSRGAKVLLITDSAESASTDKITTLTLPKINELFSPSLSVAYLQLLAYYVAANKGCDIDKPRNLAKSVTVE